VQSRRAILSADAATDSRFNASESIVDCRIRSVMCVPFLGADGLVLGVIHVDSRDVRNGFDQSDLVVLAGIAGQAAQAVEQAVALHDMLERRDLSLDAVLEFRVPEDELVHRLKGRGRADDTEDVIRNRMKVYRDETAPLLDYYHHELKTVDAVGAQDEVFARALHVLGR
jgi:adenylate kinase family enzyme